MDPRMTRITERIWLGNYADAKDIARLKREGITHVLSCAGELPMVDYPNGIVNVKLDLDDDPRERIANVFVYTNRFIEDALRGDGKILVHCAAGISRSATVLAWYLMTKTGASPAAVIAYLRSRRPIVNPNPGFRNALAVEGLKRAAHTERKTGYVR